VLQCATGVQNIEKANFSPTKQGQSIIMSPAAAATSSPHFHGIDISSGDTERTELENVSHNSILHAFLLSRQINLEFTLSNLASLITYSASYPVIPPGL
jgi:hypothetical protein